MEHSWSACLGSFAHSSPHIGKLHDGQQYSPVTGLRKMLVSQPLFTFPDFFGHLRHVRQQGVVLCLGPIAAGWSESTLSGLFQPQINHFLITFYCVSLTLSFSLSFSVTFSLSLFLTSSRGLISRLALRYRPSPGSLATSKHFAMI